MANNETVHDMLVNEAEFVRANLRPGETLTRSRLGETVGQVHMTIQITSCLVPTEVNV